MIFNSKTIYFYLFFFFIKVQNYVEYDYSRILLTWQEIRLDNSFLPGFLLKFHTFQQSYTIVFYASLRCYALLKLWKECGKNALLLKCSQEIV